MYLYKIPCELLENYAISRNKLCYNKTMQKRLLCGGGSMINQNKNDNRRRDERAATPVRKKGNWLKPLSVAFITCVFALLLVMPMLYADDLEIGPEIIDQPMRRSTLPAPTIGKVFYDATTISGDNVQRKRVGGKIVRSTVYVTLKDKDGNVKATASVTPRTGTSWTVNLPGGVTVAAGDTVTAYQTLGNDTSDVVTANAEPSMAGQITLTMPVGEIWIEQTNANLVSDDEQAEAVDMLKKANPDIANDFDSVKFSIDGTDHAYYEVTYTDGSTSGKVEAPDLKIKTVTEKSAAPTIEKVQVTDEQIIVTLSKEVAPGTKFYFVKNFTDGEDKNFCQDGNCKVDKSTSQEMSQAVSVDGTKVTFPIKDDDLELGREFGIIVKEPHKFRSCAKSEPVITTPDKVAVRDPKKLTDADKTAIENAIRNANKTDSGVSKLPDGTGFYRDIPAFIEFDKDGNARIINPSNVKGSWSNGKFTPNKKADGSLDVKDENEVIKYPAKDLVKNIAPKSPAIAVNTDTGKVTITPPAYENPGEDTDLASYTITYKDKEGNDKTITLKRTVDGAGKTIWTSDGAEVDAESGVVTLQIKDLAVGATIKARAKDNGGLIPEEEPLESDPVSETLETIKVTYDPNGGTGTMEEKKLNKGSGESYPILENKFTPPANKEFDYWEVNGEKKKAGDPITIGKDDVKIKAIWKDQPTPDKPSKPEVPEVKKPEKINGYYPFRPYFLAGKNSCQMVRDWGEDDVKEMLDQFNAHANWYKENHVPDVDQIAEHINMHGYELLAKEYSNEYGTLSFRFGKPVTLAEWKNLLNKDSTLKARFADPAEQAIDQVDEAGNKVMVHNKTYYVPVYIDYKPKTYKVYWDIVPNKTSIEQAMGYWPGRDINEKYDRLVGGSPFNADLWVIHHIGKPDPCKPNNQVAFPLPDYRTHDKAGLWFYAPEAAPKAVKVKGSKPIKYKVTFEYIFAGTETYQKYYRK